MQKKCLYIITYFFAKFTSESKVNLNLVIFRSKNCIKRNLSPSILRWSSLQTKEGQRHTDVILLCEVSIEHLQRVRYANRWRLLLRTPGLVPFCDLHVSNVETNLSWTCLVSRLFEFVLFPDFLSFAYPSVLRFCFLQTKIVFYFDALFQIGCNSKYGPYAHFGSWILISYL